MIAQSKTEVSAATTVRSMSLALRGLVGGGVIGLACALGAGAHAQTLAGLTQITGGDPFTNCTADNVNSQEKAFGSILYPNTNIEPWATVDTTNGSRVVIGHHQDRWNDGGARGLVGNISTDGGGTWSPTIPPGTTECAGGKFGRGSDPWLDFTPSGTAFFLSLVLDPARPTTPFGARNSGVLVSRSTDHVATWEAPTTLIQTHTAHALNDKTSLTADKTKDGNVYAVWDQLSVFPASQADTLGNQLTANNDGTDVARQIVGLLQASAAGGAPVFKFFFTGPTFFAMTSDDGDNWSAARSIFDPGTNAQTINNITVVPPSGTVFDFFTSINVSGCTSSTTLCITYITSPDKGTTWTGPTFVTDIQVTGAGVATPDTGGPVRDAEILSSVAVDPVNGNLYLVWQDNRFSTANCIAGSRNLPVDSIAFSQSTDGGATWSSPVKINKTPTNVTPCRQQAFVPAVVVASDGSLVVTYYDFRNDTNTPKGFEGTDYFALFCTGGCTNPASWGNEQRLTSNGSFNILDAPIARGHFLGDYMGLAANKSKKVFPVFGIATAHNVTAEFTNVITLP